jgi:precorrin-8X/cobalt-precorrin-8 methylmutase
MEWHRADIEALAIIDREIDCKANDPRLSPAEYEIVRRVIQVTADYAYQDILRFSAQALLSGAAAIATRTPIIVDSLTVHSSVIDRVRATFANPVYCATETITRPQSEKSQAAWGMETLAKRYPEAIAIIGESQEALDTILRLTEATEIEPALIIGMPPCFFEPDRLKNRLQASSVPHIYSKGYKGNALAAAAILNVLIDLTWEVQGNRVFPKS